MKLIRKLEIRKTKSGKLKRFGLFLCSYCNKKVEKPYESGLIYKSCGCSTYKISSESLIKHGDCKRSIKNKNGNRKVNRLYQIYNGMIDRCYNEKNKDYHIYGNKNIKVCDEWLNSYEKFKKWLLNNNYQDYLTIDRINNDKDYEPSNCKFSTRAQQVQNSSKAKLNWNSVRLIRRLFKNGLNRKQIYTMFNISKVQIQKIINNKSWIESEVII